MVYQHPHMAYFYNMITGSNGSTPSPPASSSLHAPTLPETPEVKMEAEEPEVKMEVEQPEDNGAGPSTSIAASFVNPQTPFDLTTLLQGNPSFQALLASGAIGDNPTLAIAKLFGCAKGSPATPGVKREAGSPPIETGKKTRLKVFSNGFFMTFDKISSCQNKHFWRCEYKNTCKARMHTDINSEKIVTYIHEHNHSRPTDEEIKLYGLDPNRIERNRVYVVGNIADPNQRRKIRKQVAEQEAAAKRLEAQRLAEQQKQQNAATIAAAQAAYARAISSMPTSSAAAASLLQAASSSSTAPPAVGAQMNTHELLLAQLPFLKQEIQTNNLAPQVPIYASPNLQFQRAPMPSLIIPKEEPTVSQLPPIKRRAESPVPDDSDWRRDPMFEPTFEIARKLRKLWKGEPSRYPRTNNAPSTHLEFFLSKHDGSEEHLYIPMRIEQRDEAHLKEALQEFCGQKCIGMLLFGISPKISVMFNQPMISSWDNNQFFLLDVSNPSRWRLLYVDDQTS